MKNTHTLYLCYFGLREPLVQTQVLPYLREIKKIHNLKVSLLTFEPDFKKKWTAEQLEAEKEKLAEENITWHCLPYHKRPSVLATLYDILCGAWFVWRLMRREKIDVLHARVHVPAILGLIARNFSRHKPKLLFDIRGFVPEEYIDAGIWKENGWIYKIFKRIEKWILRESDGFVVLTEKAREILFPESAETGFDKFGRPVEVIPCCVDFEKRFQGNQDKLRKKTRDEFKLNDRLVITHLGALGGLYLTEDIANFLQVAKSKYPTTFALFPTQTSPDLIITLLKERGFTEEDFFVGKISSTEVQRYLSASDIGLSFVKATYATASRSPTKIPEYLACGLPIVSNRGVGDVDELIIEENVGILLDDFSSESYADALKQVIALGNDANFIKKCRICAKNRFDLEKVGGERYRRIYNHLLNDFSHTLYLCYFGLREPLVQTQVLPYLREIKKIDNLKVSLLTFEPDFKKTWTTEQIEAEKKKLAEENISWYCLPYHKRPSIPATSYDILCGAWFVWRLMRRKKIDVLHARVHVPAIMGAIAKKFSSGRKPKLLFDIRGFFPEEYTDAGIWKKNGWIYRGVKRIEKWLLRESDGFVVLTEKAREILFPESREKGFDKFGRPVEVIPCCVSLARFESANDVSRNKVRKNLNIEDRKVIVYVGSFGGWYLTKETADFFGAAKEKYPNVFALILTQSPTKLIKPLLENRGFNTEDFLITQVLPKEIPLYLSASDVAISFIKSCYSKQASSPTKNAEYLACGLPIIVNSGVGDTVEITVEDKTGVIIEEFNRENYRRAFTELEKLLENKKSLAERCRESAEVRFDLQSVGGARYQKLYRRLLAKD